MEHPNAVNLLGFTGPMRSRMQFPDVFSRPLALLFLLVILFSTPFSGAESDSDSDSVIGEFLLLLLGSEEGKNEALDYVDANWQPDFTPMLLEVLIFNRDPAFGPRLIKLLEAKTGQRFAYDLHRWQQWWWTQEPVLNPEYADFKGALYGLIDERFERYFELTDTATIRLDEVVWGGVQQDGIPPLRNPRMLPAKQADYLADSDIVFGLEVNGEARAYPRRVLGWHEMFTDEISGVPVMGVYCTLCGTMILYKTRHLGVNHSLGTSGFLYRSNKLMYDKATSSLWNTIWGTPVVGPLADQGISLERMSVVTTTWGEWRRRHPESQVLSSDTGYSRDYSEGAAYRDYNASDDLMFTVPTTDTRLKLKDEVLGLVFPQHPQQPLAISAAYLAANPIHHDRVGDLQFVVLTDQSGANRVYQTDTTTFTHWDRNATATDTQGVSWSLDEAALRAADGRVLHRLPAQRAFWFGWYSAYTHTRLVH